MSGDFDAMSGCGAAPARCRQGCLASRTDPACAGQGRGDAGDVECLFRADAGSRLLRAAKAAEDAVMRGEPLGLLHGVPFSAKDLMAVAGVRYASGSRTMANNVAAGRCAGGRAREGRRRHSDRQDHDQRIRLQAGRRQPVDRDYAPSVESRQDAGRLERGRGGVGRRRHHAVRARHRWRRLGRAFRAASPASPASRRISAACRYGPPRRRRRSPMSARIARNVGDAALLLLGDRRL